MIVTQEEGDPNEVRAQEAGGGRDSADPTSGKALLPGGQPKVSGQFREAPRPSG